MKSPNNLSQRLAKQWQDNDTREQRLLTTTAWPVQLTIGKPTAQQFVKQPALVREHTAQWRNVKTGDVLWTEKKYLKSSENINLPEYWKINTPSEWIAATANSKIQQEFKILEKIITSVDPLFHSLIIRKRNLVITKPITEIIQACQVAQLLTPNYAQGRPLRAVSVANCDSKFYERNRNLLTQLLDIRFDNVVSDMGLENFLGAIDEKDHWLLIAPLDSRLLPFQQFRLRTTELVKTELPASHIIIIENEQCLYQLPTLPNTIAILGSGFDLSWLKAPWLKNRTLAYWGDIDTWGLTILANAKIEHPDLTALLMDQNTFEKYKTKFSVMEPQRADSNPPSNLNIEERELYLKLYSANKGRLEQEFLPESEVKKAFNKWYEIN